MTQATKKLRNWNDLTEEIVAPPAVIAALATGRPEMLKLAVNGAATEEETKALYNVIRVLMETNRELQQHSQQVAENMKQARLTLRGLQGQFNRLHELASFTEADDEEEED
jgi:hypothetical protein